MIFLIAHALHDKTEEYYVNVKYYIFKKNHSNFENQAIFSF